MVFSRSKSPTRVTVGGVGGAGGEEIGDSRTFAAAEIEGGVVLVLGVPASSRATASTPMPPTPTAGLWRSRPGRSCGLPSPTSISPSASTVSPSRSTAARWQTKTRPSQAAAAFGLGRLEYSRGRYAAAAADLRQARDLYAKLKLTEEEALARKAAERAAARAPSSDPPARRPP